MIRVVYLSAEPMTVEEQKWLQGSGCEIVWAYPNAAPYRLSSLDEVLVKKEYDLGLNFLGSHKISPEELAKAPWVNFHPAPLPEFAGRNVAYHAIMNGELSFGATCHYMDEGFDSGDIIEVARYPVEKSDTAGDLVRKSRQCCVDLFKKWVPELLKGKVPATPQDRSKRTYYHREQLDDRVHVQPWEERRIKALVCPPHLPHVVAGDRKYKLVPMED